MHSKLLKIAALASVITASAPALAADPVYPAASSSFAMNANASVVEKFYAGRSEAPLWLRDAAATDQLLALLRSAPIDGLASGPALAAEAEAKIVLARGGDAASAKAAERLLTAAWLRYLEVLYAPVPGVLYSDPFVRARVPAPMYSLQQAARATSLAVHVSEASRVNPIRARLREAALAEAKLPGGGKSAILAANLDRARLLPATGRFVVVDVPSARLWMYENGQPVDSMKVVVGENKTVPTNIRTPMIASVIYYATLNPYWHVPDHLVNKVVATGYMKQGASYLKSKGYEIVDRWANDAAIVPPESVDWKGVKAGTVHIKVRQKPNGLNSMGKMKFPFPNPEGIFLHDTPAREHFAKADRAISNGCIRLEDARRFGRWLFGTDPATMSKLPEQFVQMTRGVPIYVTYLTARPEGDTIAYSKDVYGFDSIAGSGRVAIQ